MSRSHGIAIGVGVVGAGLLAVAAAFDPRRVAFAYLCAWLYWLSIALGALLLVMIHHLTGSTWFIVLRRLAEALFAALVPLALLAVPLLFAPELLYPWTHPGDLEPHLRELVAKKAAWLDLPFFGIRGLLYLAIWLASAVLLARWSAAQDRGDGAPLAQRQKVFCAAALPATALALTFASFDWVMSLSPAWASSVFGVYVFAGAAIGGLAAIVLAAFFGERGGRLRDVVTVSHFHALGKLLFTFVVFWAYIAFFQFFIIWIANVPEETSWYVVRTRGGYGALGLILVVGQFLVPFFLLLSRARKRRPERLAAVAAWLLAMHYVDVYWLVIPAYPVPGWQPHWSDPVALVATGALAALGPLWWSGRTASVPRGDPRFERSLRFVTR